MLALVLIPAHGGDLVGLGIRVALLFFSSVGFVAGLLLVPEPRLSGCNLRLAGRDSDFDLIPGAVLGLLDGADLTEFAGFWAEFGRLTTVLVLLTPVFAWLVLEAGA